MNLGIEPPKGVLLFGPPGTGKTLCARAVANRTDACFIRVIGSELVQKYVGEVKLIIILINSNICNKYEYVIYFYAKCLPFFSFNFRVHVWYESYLKWHEVKKLV